MIHSDLRALVAEDLKYLELKLGSMSGVVGVCVCLCEVCCVVFVCL